MEKRGSLELHNSLDNILACQEAEIASMEMNDAPAHLVSIQRDILAILKVFADSVEEIYVGGSEIS